MFPFFSVSVSLVSFAESRLLNEASYLIKMLANIARRSIVGPVFASVVAAVVVVVNVDSTNRADHIFFNGDQSQIDK